MPDLQQLDQRDVRALTSYMSVLDDVGLARGAEDLYVVVSDSGREYLVDIREGACKCPDHRYRDIKCAHIRRVEFAIGLREVPSSARSEAIDPDLGRHVDDVEVDA